MRFARVFCSTLLLSLPSLAAHATTVVLDREVPPGMSVAGASFEADASLGRAWVVVDFLDRGGEEDLVYSERVPVPGLTYDAASRTIHLEDGGRDVTCAVGKRVLWATGFRPTGDCPVRVQQGSQANTLGNPHGEKTLVVVDVSTILGNPH